ncbi:MAG: gliding motility-associated C-terminal domain-containing protein, partial [Bacteroidales bacterium]|nr:gliding motility-associated C-terminal domain-containing protein [Bacteroidales bacterium]
LQKADYKYLIRAVSNDGLTSSSCQASEQIRKPTNPKFVYIRSASVKMDNSGVELLIYTDTSGVASNYEVFSSEDGVSWNSVGFLPPNPSNPNLMFDYLTNTVEEKALYFRVSASDSCGNPLLISDSSLTIFLQVSEQDAYKNRLDWSAYAGFLNKNGNYRIYRYLDDISFPVFLDQVPDNQLTYVDDISTLTSSAGVFSYVIMVSEKGPNANFYGFLDSAASNTARLIKESVVVFPNAFHPTSPILENRIFKPLGAFINPENYLFQIFDRWGNLVFLSTNPADFWDGTKNGKDLIGGVYMYLLKYQNLKGELILKRGSVTMIR